MVKEHAVSWSTVRMPLQNAHGFYLAESLAADRDGPPFNRVAMDGIAIASSADLSDSLTFPCEGMQAAGSPQLTRTQSKSCVEAMTGAVLPANCDMVIPFEKITKLKNGHYKITEEVAFKPWLNVHTQATDFNKGFELLKTGTKLRPTEIAVAASLGASQPLIYIPPSIGIITTGSELVDINQEPLDLPTENRTSTQLRHA